MFYDIDICNIASYADDNTPYTSDFNLEEVMQKLELTTNNLFEWFKNNHMKANTDKCHLLVTRDTDVTIKIGEFDVKNTLQIPDSYYEKMKTQNKHIIVHFEYFFHLSL